MPSSSTPTCDGEPPGQEASGTSAIVNLPRSRQPDFFPAFCRQSTQANWGLAGSPDLAISEMCSWTSMARAMHWSELWYS